MKSLITILAALLIIAVSHYAHASKAQNGAKDSSVKVVKEDTKSDRLSIADLKDFSVKSFDDRVLEFRRGDELITMIPLMDYKFSKERRQVFEDSQVLAEKLMKVWLERALHIRFNGSQDMMEQELISLTASEIRKKFTQGGMPSRAEIIAASADAREAAEILKKKAKFLVEYDELIATFDKYQEEAIKSDSFFKEKLTPSAFMFLTNFRISESLLEALRKTKYGAGPAFILKSSMTLSITIRPWKVVKRNLNTGVVTSSSYYETSTQAWAMKDFKTDKMAVKGPLRLGAGLLLGNFNRMSNVHGAALGLSASFNFRKSMLDGELLIPTHTNVKIGVIGGLVETFAQTTDLRNVAKHGYFMVTKQFGFQTPTGRTANGDIGAVVNFNALAERFGSFDQETLDGIIETALSDIPGADVVVKKDEVEILIPDQTKKPTVPATEEKKQNSPKTDDPVPLKGQEDAPVQP